MKPKGLKRILAVTLASLILLCGVFIARAAFTGAMLLCALYGNMDDGGFIYANF